MKKVDKLEVKEIEVGDIVEGCKNVGRLIEGWKGERVKKVER